MPKKPFLGMNGVGKNATGHGGTVYGFGKEAEKAAAGLPLVRLYPRQEEILRLMYKGQSNKEMARVLDLSVGTVKNHVAAILHAFNVNSRSKAVKVAIEGGYIHSRPVGDDALPFPDAPSE